jgi:hypothetical protein
MQPIFISYRRHDAEGEAGRLFADLTREFGDKSVFMDVSTITAGRDFRKAINESVSSCGVLLAVLGLDWVNAKKDTGERRLEDPADFVRLETAAALKRDIPVIPVLVQGAKMPTAGDLPEDLRDFAYRNAVELTHARWSSDVQILIQTLRQLVGVTSPPAPQPKPHVGKLRGGAVLGTLGLVVAAGVGIFYLSSSMPISVPDVSGKSLAEATAILGAAHLSVGATRIEVDPSKEPESVTSQSLAAGASVRRGGKVDLVLTPPLVAVPDAVGKPLRFAEVVLQKQDLLVGDIQREKMDGAAANSVLKEFPPAGTSVRPGSTIALVVAEEAPGGTPVQQAGLSEGSSNKPAIESKPSYPNFAGTWELIETTYNGAPQHYSSRPLVITQNGDQVTIGDRTMGIRPDGAVSYQSFAAGAGQGHTVGTASEADLVDTLEWRLDGQSLVFQTVFDYRRTYGGHPPGKDLRIMKYRRVQ